MTNNSNINIDKIFIVSIPRTASQPIRQKNLNLLKSNMKNIFHQSPETYGVDGNSLDSDMIKTMISQGKLKNRTSPQDFGKFNFRSGKNMINLFETFFNVNKKSRNMTMGEVGCSLSHLGIFEKIVKNKYQHTLILEDDAKLLCNANNFKNELNKLFQEAPNNFYLISLFKHRDLAFNNAYTRYTQRNMVSNHLYRIHELTYGTVAYIITFEGALNMLKNLYPIRYPIDYALSRECYLKKRGYVSSPPLIDVCLYEQTTTRKY